MKSLYNISGILPAQCRSNPNDCGIAWSEHRRVEPVKREDVITVESPQLHVDPAEQSSDQTVVTAFTLKPIDPQTIQVGDTVRLVGTNALSLPWGKKFTKFKNYEVAIVDRENKQGMPVMIRNDAGGLMWMFGEDLMLVESA